MYEAIKSALLEAAEPQIKKASREVEMQKWSSCWALNVLEGFEEIEACSKALARVFDTMDLDLIGEELHNWSGSAHLVTALGYNTPEGVLREADLVPLFA